MKYVVDNKRYLWIASGATALIVFLGILISISNPVPGQNTSQINSNITGINSSSDVNLTENGQKYTIHPDELLQGCPGGKDCIPSIDNPSFVSTDRADWLSQTDKVIGLEINNDSRAYPLDILSRHEIVNDNVGGKPVAVTYCPLCRSAVTHSRQVNGETLEFGVSGKLYNANLIMYDRQTETLWSQISGEAVVGEKVPQKLELVFSSVTDWGEWKKGHPHTKVLSRDTGIYPVNTYENTAYSGYKNSKRVGYGVNKVDDRIPSKDIVYGVNTGEQSIAVTKKALDRENVVQADTGNKNLLMFKNPSDGSVISLLSNNTNSNVTVDKNMLTNPRDEEWSLNGEKINRTSSMRRLPTKEFYWFAWSKFNPQTELYK